MSNLVREPASQEQFESRARPVIQELHRELGRSPTIPEVRASGAGWLISALYARRRKYHALLRKWGYSPPPRLASPPAGQRPYGYWQSDDHVRTALQEHFPELLRWQICPSYHMLQPKLSGLAKYVGRNKGVTALANRLNLQSFWTGRQNRRRAEMIIWALRFYRSHHRWPVASECTPTMRDLRFQKGNSWLKFCRPSGLPAAGIHILLAEIDGHIDWMRQHEAGALIQWIPLRNNLHIELQLQS